MSFVYTMHKYYGVSRRSADGPLSDRTSPHNEPSRTPPAFLISGTPPLPAHQAIGVVQRRHLSVALFVLFVVYATVSYTVFETFVCDPLDDGNSYLRADYSLTCGTPLHTAYRVYAGLMILVYPVGVPCVFGWWLFKYRHELKEEDRNTKAELRPLADLWEPYKRKKYYYEV